MADTPMPDEPELMLLLQSDHQVAHVIDWTIVKTPDDVTVSVVFEAPNGEKSVLEGTPDEAEAFIARLATVVAHARSDEPHRAIASLLQKLGARFYPEAGQEAERIERGRLDS
jgi:hypothetical protein